MDAKACYQTAGIYFSLMLENKHQRKTNSGFWDREKTDIFHQYIFSFQTKCQAGNGPTSTTNYPTNYAKVSFSDKYIYRIYDSMRSLSKYSLKAIFACEKQGGSSGQKGIQYTRELSIAHGY